MDDSEEHDMIEKRSTSLHDDERETLGSVFGCTEQQPTTRTRIF